MVDENLPTKKAQTNGIVALNHINETFRLGDAVNHVHYMMNQVTAKEVTAQTVISGCLCVGKLTDLMNATGTLIEKMNGK